MTMHAYAESYLPDVMDNLGTMLDVAVRDWGRPLEEFYARFLSSGVSALIEKGHPRYLAGLSGVELAAQVMERTGGNYAFHPSYFIEYGQLYWTGWILAYFQWATAHRFQFIQDNGLDITTVFSLYPTLHEADPRKFVEIGRKRLEETASGHPTKLRELRKLSGLTQAELADRSDTSLRAIQAYEQRTLDIAKAEAGALWRMARVLGCTVEDLMER